MVTRVVRVCLDAVVFHPVTAASTSADRKVTVTPVAAAGVTVQTLPLTDAQPVKLSSADPAAAVAVSRTLRPEATLVEHDASRDAAVDSRR